MTLTAQSTQKYALMCAFLTSIQCFYYREIVDRQTIDVFNVEVMQGPFSRGGTVQSVREEQSVHKIDRAVRKGHI